MNELFGYVINSIREYAVFSTDDHGVITSWNPGAELILGWSADEIIGTDGNVIYTKIDLENRVPENEMKEAVEKGKAVNERYHQRKDKSVFWGSGMVFPMHNGAGDLIGFSKIMRQINLANTGDEDDAEARRYASSIVQTSREPLVILTNDKKISTGTAAFYQLLKLNPQKVDGRNIFEVLDDCYDARQLEALMTKSDSGDNIELTSKEDVNGDVRVLHLSYRMVFQTYNSGGMYLMACHDISEARKLEQAKEDFVSIASHELRSPITLIKAYTDMLMDSLLPRLNETDLKFIDKLQYQTERLATLTTSLLDISKFRTGLTTLMRERFLLNEAVDETIAQFEAHPRLPRFEIQATGQYFVYADQKKITQVLLNLVSNAIKYAPPASTVNVLITDAGAGRVRVQVSDNGPGIAPEHQKQLFKRFSRFTTNDQAQGFGLGLFICAEIMAAHHGTIGVESDGVNGSTFYFDLDTVS